MARCNECSGSGLAQGGKPCEPCSGSGTIPEPAEEQETASDESVGSQFRAWLRKRDKTE